jgi:hypothetical protein
MEPQRGQVPDGERVYTGFKFPAARKFFAQRGVVFVLRAASFLGSAMLPGMAEKPSIAIVGTGNLGTALALALRGTGCRIEPHRAGR